jgi:hypothetical protein
VTAPSQPPWASLLCRLGWHAPIKGALWNQGYYFTRCARCGVDLVRTTFSGWEAPRGQRVVWRRRSDVDQVEQRTDLPASPSLPPPSRAALSAPRPRAAAPRAKSAIPDFMDDSPPEARRTTGHQAEPPIRSPSGDRARRN